MSESSRSVGFIVTVHIDAEGEGVWAQDHQCEACDDAVDAEDLVDHARAHVRENEKLASDRALRARVDADVAAGKLVRG